MVRKYKSNDIDALMQIWCDTNIQAHDFILKEYWLNHYGMVKKMLPYAELYVYEDRMTHQINGFIGLTDNYIDGIFVKREFQSKGIGKKLLDYVKCNKESLYLSVYQKNVRAVSFYQREHFVIESENIDESTYEKEFIMTWNR